MRAVFIALAVAGLLHMPAAAAAATPASCPVQAPTDLASAGTLTFGTIYAAPPPGLKLPNLAGFELDLAGAIARTMCLDPGFVNLAFAGLFPGLNARKFDAAIAAIGISPQREESYDFVPYFLGGLRLLVRKDSGLYFQDETQVCGHAVAALAGSVEVRDLDKYKAGCPAGQPMDLRIFPSNNEVLEQLRKGTVEVVFLDWAPVAYIAAQNPQDFAIGSPILTGEPPGVPRHRDGIMLRKGDAALQTAIGQALSLLQADGTYDRLLAKWDLLEGDIRHAG